MTDESSTPQPERPAADHPVRRPPAPAGPWATVTTLVPTPGEPPDPVPLAAVQGALALDLGRDGGALAGPGLRLVPDRPAPSDREVRGWAARFAQAVVEVLGADRPLSQLVGCTDVRVYQDLERRVRVLARTSPAPLRRRTIRPQVRSVHVCRVGPRSAEVSVHVRYGPRSRALAARLDLVNGRWTCTALELG